jgi:hypothetical protein
VIQHHPIREGDGLVRLWCAAATSHGDRDQSSSRRPKTLTLCSFFLSEPIAMGEKGDKINFNKQ